MKPIKIMNSKQKVYEAELKGDWVRRGEESCKERLRSTNECS